ncbi:Elongation factor P family protein [Hibiscus syriacus]|uniref:Elongation factor P family protein n=1 Tax=Hibiscus syriacus TaxID=106335 RepID=A0A6A3CY47_HIBSY|nr:Elongation factor P family protein [Hibiscus syriacus]
MVGIGFEVEGKMISSLLRGLSMKSWEEKDLVQDTNKVFEKMRERVTVIDHTSYSFVIRTLCMGRRMGEVVYHLEQMIEMGHIPRTITFKNVIQALFIEGKIGEALVVLVTMSENGKIPSRTSYDMLVKELNQQGLLFGACNVNVAALKRGVVPHRIPPR